MSRVVLGVGASHSTLMNTHWDEVAGLDRAEAFKDGLQEARGVIERASPDAVVLVGSNHFRGIGLDLVPAFTIGVGDCIAGGEAGTPEGPQRVDVELARRLCRSLVDDDFDVAFSTRLRIDHGLSHAIQYLLGGMDVAIVPIIVNVFAPPLPSLARCEALGFAIRNALESDGEDTRVVVIASGGLSHRLPFPDWTAPASDDDRFLVEAWTEGRDNWRAYDPRRREIIRAAAPAVNSEFDRRVLDLLAAGQLGWMWHDTSEELEAEGGNGAHELRSWMVMAAACGHTPGRTIVYSPMPEWLTGMAVAVLKEGT